MLKLGILASETEFEYGLIMPYNYLIHGTVHTTANGSKRVQYASENKYIFQITIQYVTEEVWNSIVSLVGDSKLNDLNLIDHEENSHTVRIMPETITKTPIIGTALGYDISFSVIEV